MFPPVYTLAAASAPVTALLGALPAQTRLYPFGEAPQDVATPYAVWQIVAGAPENFLGTIPDADRYRVQIDVYGRSAAEVRSVAQALRDTYQTKAHVVRWAGETVDQQTARYRFSFDVDFINLRPETP